MDFVLYSVFRVSWGWMFVVPVLTGGYMEGVWRVFGRCLEGVWKVCGSYLGGVCRVSETCLKGFTDYFWAWNVFVTKYCWTQCRCFEGFRKVSGSCHKECLHVRGGCFRAWPSLLRSHFVIFAPFEPILWYGGRNVCFFKILEFQNISAIFGPVAAIFRPFWGHLRVFQCLNQKVCSAKVVRSAIL